MPFKLNKIIFQRDHTWGSETYTYDLKTEIEFPYVAGKLQELIPTDPKTIRKYKPEISNQPLFNQNGLTKLIPEVGPRGIYYLELRAGYKLEKLFVEPDDVVVDIFFGGQATVDNKSSDKNLVYSFYNPTRRSTINISGRLVKDADNIWTKIFSNATDLYWRQYFIKDAMVGNRTSAPNIASARELMNQEQVADYLQVTKKTIQNWTSSGKIPFEKLSGTSEVRYRKSTIDSQLSIKISKPRRKKRN